MSVLLPSDCSALLPFMYQLLDCAVHCCPGPHTSPFGFHDLLLSLTIIKFFLKRLGHCGSHSVFWWFHQWIYSWYIETALFCGKYFLVRSVYSSVLEAWLSQVKNDPFHAFAKHLTQWDHLQLFTRAPESCRSTACAQNSLICISFFA